MVTEPQQGKSGMCFQRQSKERKSKNIQEGGALEGGILIKRVLLTP
jgi:hypothetical protein